MKQRILIIGSWVAMPATALIAMPAIEQPNNQFASIPLESSQAAPVPHGPETVTASVEKIGVQGNWVKKREWLIKANEALAEIQEIAVHAESLRKTFIEKYHAIDAQLDKYYHDIGTSQGKLHELFDSVFRYLEKKRAQEVANLNSSTPASTTQESSALIDTIEDSIKTSRNQLDQLKLDMKSIEDLGQSLVDRLNRLDQQLSTIQENATRAHAITTELWSIIDHNKARDHYYELKLNILETLKNIQTYLNNDLMQDFDSVIGTIQTQINRTQEQIKKLEGDGLFIKNRAERVHVEKAKQAEIKQQAKSAQEATERAQKAVPQPSHQKNRGPFTVVYNFFINMLAMLYNAKSSLIGLMFGPSEQPKKAVSSSAAIPHMPSGTDAPEATQKQTT